MLCQKLFHLILPESYMYETFFHPFKKRCGILLDFQKQFYLLIEALEYRNQVNRKCVVLQNRINKVLKAFLEIHRHFAQNCQLCKLLTLQKLHALPTNVTDS